MANADPYRSKALKYSATLHALLLLFAIFGLPELWRAHRESLPTAMTVEVLPIGQTNVKPKPAHKPEQKPKEKPKAKEQVKPKPKSYTEEKAQPKTKTEAVPLPKPKEKAKEPEKKKPEPEKKEETKKAEPDFDAILKSVADAAQEKEKDSKPSPAAESKKAVSDSYNPSLPLAMSEIDAIRQQFIQCWNIPAGAKDAHNLIVVLDVRLAKDGGVISVDLASDTGRYYSDPFFRAAADSAMRAVQRCSPIKNLSPDKYDSWKYLQLSFDPHELLY